MVPDPRLTQNEAIFLSKLFSFAQGEDLACISQKEKLLIFEVHCSFFSDTD